MDPEKPFGGGEAPASGGAAAEGPPLKDDPKYAKFFKMLKMHLPKIAVENKMRAAGLDPSVLDNPNAPAGHRHTKRPGGGRTQPDNHTKNENNKMLKHVILSLHIERDSRWSLHQT